jgi:hypothetical protein
VGVVSGRHRTGTAPSTQELLAYALLFVVVLLATLASASLVGGWLQ